MELLKRNIHMDCQKREGMTQITLEEDRNLPEMKPDVSSLCMEKGAVVMEEVRPMADAVTVKGRLLFSVLYYTQEEGGRLVCTEGKIPFEEKIRMEGLSASDNVTVSGEVDDLTVGMINSRKLSIQSVITLRATVEESYEEELPTGMSGADGEDVQVRLTPMEFSQAVLCKRDVVRVKEELMIPTGYPNIGQILWKSVEPGEMDFRLGEEKLSLQGEIRVFVLYEGEGETNTPQIYESTVPVTAQIPCDGCHEWMAVDVQYGLGQCELTPKADPDGEQRAFGLELTLELRLCVYEDQSMEVMSDLYGVKEELNGEKKQVELERLLRSVTGKTKVEEHIRLGEEGQVLQLIHSDGRASLSAAEVAGDTATLRGSIVLQILYVTGEDEKPYGCLKTSLPFEYTLEIPGMTEQGRLGRVQTKLENLSVTMPDGEELDVKAVLCFSVSAFEPVEAEVISSVEERPLNAEKMEALPGMVIYVAKRGEDLWNIGKKYYVPVQTLMEVNHLSGREPEEGQKLLIVKGV